MLPLPPFALHQPQTLAHALELRAALPKARILAGGTDLLPSLKQGLFAPPALISLGQVPGLSGIRRSARGFEIGAMTSLAELGADPEVERALPGLRAACRGVATPTIQSMATLGGNLLLDTRCRFYNQSVFWREALGQQLQSPGPSPSGCLKCDPAGICHIAPKGLGCYAAMSADTVPTLLLLNAEVDLASLRGTRRIPLHRLYGEDGREGPQRRAPRVLIARDELLTAVHIPTPLGPTVHSKLRAREAIDFPLLLVAASAQGVVLGALGPKPIVVPGAAELLESQGIDAVAERAFKLASPLSTHVWPSTWRKKMVRVYVRRALQALAEHPPLER